MAFNIRMGLPEMEAFWRHLATRKQQGKLDREEEKFFKKLVKALAFLGLNPRHPGLASHEIDDLTRKHGMKIFQSYLENKTPAAGRLFWAYGPDQGDITVLAIEPHPEDQKRGAYQRIKLSALPAARPKPGGKYFCPNPQRDSLERQTGQGAKTEREGQDDQGGGALSAVPRREADGETVVGRQEPH